jgi:nitrile hydratase
MDGIHDMGGMQGFGEVAGRDEQTPFPHPWEGKAFSLGLLSMRVSGRNLHAFRHAIERVPPVEYLADGYNNRWLRAAETLITDSGILAEGAVDARAHNLAGHAASEPADPEPDKPTMESGGPGNLRQIDAAPRFAPGDRVRAKQLHPRGHTRLPGYIRGHLGTVTSHRPGAVLPDTAAHVQGENPQHVYAVEFAATELWGPDSEPFTLTIDLYEPYLESAS